MRPEDTLLTEAVDRLQRSEDAAFFDELWTRVAESEERSQRRWRLATIAAVLIALAALASTAVVASTHASNIVDRTIACGVRGFQLTASADMPAHTAPGSKPTPAGIAMQAIGGTVLSFDDAHSGELLSNKLCLPAKRIPLSRTGLVAGEVYKAGDYIAFLGACFRGRFAVRVRIVDSADGVPTSAIVAVRLVKSGLPILYIVWSPAKVVPYFSRRCM